MHIGCSILISKFYSTGEIMVNFNDAIDTIQASKKQGINKFVQNKTIAGAMNTFIDAQSDYTKLAVNSGSEAFTAVTKEMAKVTAEFTKFDFVKFGEGIAAVYRNPYQTQSPQ